jgi:hypothetical protein
VIEVSSWFDKLTTSGESTFRVGNELPTLRAALVIALLIWAIQQKMLDVKRNDFINDRSIYKGGLTVS